MDLCGNRVPDSVAHPRGLKLLVFWASAIAIVSVGRICARSLSRRHIAYMQNTIIVGAGEVGQLVARKFLQHPEYGINLVGFVDAEPKERREDIGDLALLGPSDRLPALVRLFDVERVIVAFSRESHEETIELIRTLRDLNVQVDIVPRLFEIVGPSFDVHTVEGLPLVGLPTARISRSSRAIKRMIDIVVAFVALIVLKHRSSWSSHVAISSESRGRFSSARCEWEPVSELRILKFRTMVRDADLRKH